MMAVRKRLTVAEMDHNDRMKTFIAEEQVNTDKGARRFSELWEAQKFKPGREKTGGRVKGTPNKITAIMREGIEKAAERAGYVYVDKAGRHRATGKGGVDGYLTSLAEHHPNIFMKIWMLMMTAEFNGKIVNKPEEQRIFRTMAEMKQRMKERGIPIPPHLKELEKPVHR